MPKIRVSSLTLLAVVSASVLTVSVSSQQRPGTARNDPPAAAPAPAPPPPAGRAYVGSEACGGCHRPIYERWAKTRMANVVVDPRQHRDRVLPDFNKPDPLLTFKLDDVAFVYGSKWKQRYFTKVGNDYYPLPAQWDVTHRIWRAYNVQPNTDWWVPFYPPGNMQRPTGPLCDGCHSVNYNAQLKTVTEWNVGCERCHGPGSQHIANPSTANIVNPARLDFTRATDTCIQCHSQGQPVTNPLFGQYYDWAVGFHQGGNLRDYWKLEEHKLGDTNFMHYADGTAHKNRMQGNDFVQSVMYRRGVTCFSCHDVHGTSNNADTIKPARDLCITCHNPGSPNGPHNAATIEEHTHHAAGSAGNLCVSCHMPQIAQTIADVNVRSHTFEFITPSMTDQYKIPNPCTGCHTEKSTDWARDTLRTWTNVSRWRVE
jgi:predicted CXXCH cytochrome family protein